MPYLGLEPASLFRLAFPSDAVPIELSRLWGTQLVTELRSCVRIEVDVLGSPSLIVRTVSVDVKYH